MYSRMNLNPLRELEACGQSVWTDVISSRIIHSGTLARYIASDGISGVTANPAIFEKAIVGTRDYDEAIRSLGTNGSTACQIYEKLAMADVGAAADLLLPIYDRTGGHDGFVSIEVSPELAADTAGTIAEARRFWAGLGRPNVMIKVPATPAGMPAIEELTADGINVNITLIFSVRVYEDVMAAFLTGLERRVEAGQPIDRVASVASFFVSRVDTLVDTRLGERIRATPAAGAAGLAGLAGKAAVANAKVAYLHFERVFGSERFKHLRDHGAQIQRPLWASTSTKNPSYPDTMYVDTLIGPHTVNTMTLDTIEAFRDHGTVACDAIRRGVDEAQQVLGDLERAGIDMTAVTNELTADGLRKFTVSLHALLGAIEERRGGVGAVKPTPYEHASS